MKTKRNHTPGPWEAIHSGTGDAIVRAPATGWTNKDGSLFHPTIVPRIGWEDARLIAAAPDLLEACHAALSVLAMANVPDGTTHTAKEAFDAVLAAINKASL